jgi:transcriptional regulator with XRE-family HTH domain
VSVDPQDRKVRLIDDRSVAILARLSEFIRDGRRARRWSQRRLASEAGCAQSTVARIERRLMPDVSLCLAFNLMAVLGLEPELGVARLRVTGPPVSDAVHARCVGAIVRRLSRAGFLVATEVPIGGPRSRGFIDVIAMHPVARVLVVIEVKALVDDLGAIDRQLATYLGAAWDAAASFGWRPRAVTGLLLVLATDENDRRLRSHRELVDVAFGLRARDLSPVVRGIPSVVPPRGARGLAMIDPSSRRRDWLLRLTLDGRRTAAPYTDRHAFLSQVRR